MSLSGTIRAGAAYVEVTAQTSKLQRGLATAQAQLQNFGRSCTAIGKDMLMLSGAFAVPMAMAVKGFADFDDQMRLVRAVTKATKQEFESLTQVAAKLGRETSFTAKQVADGMVSLGRMGFSPKEIEQAIQPTLDLARATGTDLGEAANIAANSMRIFGIEASKMSDVADILTATANGSARRSPTCSKPSKWRDRRRKRPVRTSPTHRRPSVCWRTSESKVLLRERH